MSNSKLHDDLINEVEPLDNPEESISALMRGIADRIEGCNGSKVKLSDLATVLRENPDAVGKAVFANTPLAKTRTKTTNADSASTVFDKPVVKTQEQTDTEKKATEKAAAERKALDDKAAADYRAAHQTPAPAL